jgi:Protein of unknown function (DUF4238)
MPEPDPRAFDEGPYGQELIQIELGLKPWPEPDAKRQHFIPRFLLNRFAMADGRLIQLDTKTGTPQKVAAKRAASRHRFYTFADDEGNKSSVVEGIFGMAETHAAPALQRLEDDGEIDDVDRATISLFLAHLWTRTPAVRRLAEKLAEETAAGLLASHFADRDAFEGLLAEQAAEDPEMRKAPEEAEDLRRRTLKMLGDGSLKITSPDGGAPTNILIEVAHDTSMLIFTAMEWTLMRAEGARRRTPRVRRVVPGAGRDADDLRGARRDRPAGESSSGPGRSSADAPDRDPAQRGQTVPGRHARDPPARPI